MVRHLSEVTIGRRNKEKERSFTCTQPEELSERSENFDSNSKNYPESCVCLWDSNHAGKFYPNCYHSSISRLM